MAKVSIGLRGWRFDEGDVFTEDGELRPVDHMPADVRSRILRLERLIDTPCDACWLIHGEDDLRACNPADVVYGEPMAEVVLCDDHEADLLYWYRECGGAAHRGEETFQDAFHEWFDAGNRAPANYGTDEHVETEPEALPAFEPPGNMEPEVTPADVGLGEDRLDLRSLKRDE